MTPAEVFALLALIARHEVTIGHQAAELAQAHARTAELEADLAVARAFAGDEVDA